MTEMILPGTYIEVRPEGLIAPGQVTVGNVAVVGTARKGPVGKPTLLSNYNDALSIFGSYDSFTDPDDPTKRRNNALTLVRALELVFANGGSTVFALRVADGNAAWAKATLKSAGGDCVTLAANSKGTWGNAITANVTAPDSAADILMYTETAILTPGEATAKQIPLKHNSVASLRNRASVRKLDGSVAAPAIVSGAAAPAPGQAKFAANALVFGDNLDPDSVVTAVYSVDPAAFAKVTIALDTTKETYLATDGDMLVATLNDPASSSALVTATAAANSKELLAVPQNAALKGGADGEATPNYADPTTGFDALLDAEAHIIVAAGQSNTKVGAALDAHCQKASTDVFKHDRIAVVGSEFAKTSTGPLTTADIANYVATLVGNTLASDRVIFVAPGFRATSTATEDQAVNPVLLSGSYTAAAIAGMLASLSPHLSLTNKSVAVADVEVKFNNAQLTELVQNRVLALEVDRGIRVLRGQTTDNGAFREITTRRIVDYAKYGVRSAAGPYIGLLNNDRVRGALRATINSFLKNMLDDEMLVSYGLDVSATRDQQIQGIVQVTITLQPVFSINFIRVTMILS